MTAHTNQLFPTPKDLARRMVKEADIQPEHTFLKPGGRLVTICANGPRQNDKLKPLADSWEELPDGTFEGTGVRTVMLVINKPVHTKPTSALSNDPDERQRLAVAGRSTLALKESKTFDIERLAESPLFAQRGRLF